MTFMQYKLETFQRKRKKAPFIAAYLFSVQYDRDVGNIPKK